MKHFFKNIIFLPYLLCFCVIPYAIGSDDKYGLEFSSFEVVQEKRTGLNLTPEKPFSFSNGFTLSFDVRFQSNYKFSYGYVFRIIGENENHVDLLLRDTNLVVTHMGKTTPFRRQEQIRSIIILTLSSCLCHKVIQLKIEN